MKGTIEAQVIDIKMQKYKTDDGKEYPFCMVTILDDEGYLPHEKFQQFSLDYEEALRLGFDNRDTTKSLIGSILKFSGNWTYKQNFDRVTNKPIPNTKRRVFKAEKVNK